MPTSPHKIRVMIVDDHAVARSGLIVFLAAQEDMVLVAEAKNGQQALALCQTYQPDVILMDLVMPVRDGITAVRHMHKRFPNIKIVILSSFLDLASVQSVLRTGASGYLLKTISADELADSLHRVVKGRIVLSDEVTQMLVEAIAAPSQARVQLTAREQQVLTCLVEGLTNPEIAARLFISTSTVKFHLGGIFVKLNVTSRTEAVAAAFKRKLIH